MTRRLWPYGEPFVSPHVPRPKPMLRPSIWSIATTKVRRSLAWLQLLAIDAQLEDKTREAWKVGRLGHLSEQADHIDEAAWYEAEGIGLADAIAKLRRRQRVLENEVRGE